MRDQEATMTVTAVTDLDLADKTCAVVRAPEFHGSWWRRVAVGDELVRLANEVISSGAACMVREVESRTVFTLADLVWLGDADAEFVAGLRGVVL